MPVQIGATTHSFADPTGLLFDCHRRIEMFLASLERVAGLVDRPLNRDAQDALESALRYFREAAPKHTADEEDSLFPRLRQIQDPALEAALNRLEALEHDHERAAALHDEVDRLGRQCLDAGHLGVTDARRFQSAMAQLSSIYKEHIRIEDEIVFPAAGNALSDAQRKAIAGEMAERRK